jgi:hypothetical protein
MKTKSFNIGDWVVHTHISGKKFKVVEQVTPSHYIIQDTETKQTFLEPVNHLLDLIDSRDSLINFILDEKEIDY